MSKENYANVQFALLNDFRRQKIVVDVYLVSGARFQARILSFDSSMMLLEREKTVLVVYHHAVSSLQRAKFASKKKSSRDKSLPHSLTMTDDPFAVSSPPEFQVDLSEEKVEHGETEEDSDTISDEFDPWLTQPELWAKSSFLQDSKLISQENRKTHARPHSSVTSFGSHGGSTDPFHGNLGTRKSVPHRGSFSSVRKTTNFDWSQKEQLEIEDEKKDTDVPNRIPVGAQAEKKIEGVLITKRKTRNFSNRDD